MADRSQSSVPRKLHPSSLFKSSVIDEYVANVDAYNTARLEKQKQKPTSREETRRQYVEDWSSDWNTQEDKNRESAGSAGPLHKIQIQIITHVITEISKL
ncbi:MAG: hypothetical protein Q9209_003337 [Squamulea sp. 1 TL-2023]